MSDAVIVGILCAVLVFWGIGAHNRLVRLRALAIAAFSPLEAQYGKFPALAQVGFSSLNGDDRLSARTGLLGAALQFEASLKVACAHPLDVLSMRVLETAHEALQGSWMRACSKPLEGGSDPMPDTLQQQWTLLALQVHHARDEFNLRVQDYNQAIHQFPANLLAWLFGFKPAYQIKEKQ